MNAKTMSMSVAGLAGAVGITTVLSKLPPIADILSNPLYLGGAALALLVLLK